MNFKVAGAVFERGFDFRHCGKNDGQKHGKGYGRSVHASAENQTYHAARPQPSRRREAFDLIFRAEKNGVAGYESRCDDHRGRADREGFFACPESTVQNSAYGCGKRQKDEGFKACRMAFGRALGADCESKKHGKRRSQNYRPDRKI